MNRSAMTASATLAGLLLAMPATAMSMANLPPEQMQGPVAYRTGGVGHDEAAAMQRESSRYPLTLEFVKHATPKDEYLANIDVTIRKADGGTEASLVSDGPFLLARLPAGKYQIVASDNGMTKTRDVVIAANKPERLVFDW